MKLRGFNLQPDNKNGEILLMQNLPVKQSSGFTLFCK